MTRNAPARGRGSRAGGAATPPALLQRVWDRLDALLTPAELPLASGERRLGGSSEARSQVGRAAERAAVRHLRKSGYRILCRNRLNRLGELDVVAQKGEAIVFVEVRSRVADSPLAPQDTLTSDKRRRLALAAELFMRQHGLLPRPYWVDLIAVRTGEDGRTLSLEHFTNVISRRG